MKEQTKIRLFGVIAAIILAGMCYVFGQVTTTYRYKERPDIKTIAPTYPIEFGDVGAQSGDPKNGKFSMYVDEIGKDSADIIFYVYYPKHRVAANYEVVFKFNNGTFIKLGRTMLNQESNYAEYVVTKDAYKELFNGAAEGILFRCEDKDQMFYSPLYSDNKFFYYFLHICKNWP